MDDVSYGQLIEAMLKDARLLGEVGLHTLWDGDAVQVGGFTVEPVAVSHSIPDAVGLVITYPAGTAVYTGGLKFEQTPVDGRRSDFATMAE